MSAFDSERRDTKGQQAIEARVYDACAFRQNAGPMTTSFECPICKRKVAAPEQNPHFPFCTDRCRAIDLGKWFGGEYRFAVASADEDDDGGAAPGVPPQSDEER